MLISCSSCNSKYLVNSADLKPNGRMVKCIKCDNKWFLEPGLENNSFQDKQNKPNIISPNQNTYNYSSKTLIQNLPSTYVKDSKVSIANTTAALILLTFTISSFWLFKKFGTNLLVLINYYFHEFLFNLNLILEDLVKIIYQIIN